MVHSNLQAIAEGLLLRLMRWIYTFTVQLYAGIIFLAGFFNPKAKAWWTGRKAASWKNQNFQDQQVVWFHCASLGEFDMALPLMHQLKRQFPNAFVLTTFFSPSGMKHYEKRDHCVDFACYLPNDTSSNARAFLQHIQPQAAIFMKYEFWRNHLFELERRNIPRYSVSAIFRPNQMFFKAWGGFQRKILKTFTWIFVQNESSKKLLNQIGIEACSVAGDLRFENVMRSKTKTQTNPIFEGFTTNQRTMVLGSTWPVDEAFLLPFINSSKLFDRFIIAPHEISDKHLQDIEKGLSVASQRYTQWNSDLEAKVLILDTIGHLSKAYQYGQIAYVGGGQTGALHNILEPAAFGLPVLFGPKHSKFPEAQTFLDLGFAQEVTTSSGVEKAVNIFQSDLENLEKSVISYMDSKAELSNEILHQMNLSLS